MEQAAGPGLRGIALCVVCAVALIVCPAADAVDQHPDLGVWRFRGHSSGIFTRSQGVATDPSIPGVTLYSWALGLEWVDSGGRAWRRAFGIPFILLLGGYLHVGDVDAHGGKAYLPYERGSGDPEIAFGVVDMRTSRIEKWSVHAPEPGETDHNSWVAVTPDGTWLVSGQWEDMSRIRVLAIADLGRPEVDVASWIELDVPVDRVQGCDFETPVRLVCLDDTAERQLIQIDLERPLDGVDVDGHATWLGATPVDHAVPWLSGVCPTLTETEGVDVRGDELRFLTIDPCLLWTHEYTYTT